VETQLWNNNKAVELLMNDPETENCDSEIGGQLEADAAH
jgi:hypothetical protein